MDIASRSTRLVAFDMNQSCLFFRSFVLLQDLRSNDHFLVLHMNHMIFLQIQVMFQISISEGRLFELKYKTENYAYLYSAVGTSWHVQIPTAEYRFLHAMEFRSSLGTLLRWHAYSKVEYVLIFSLYSNGCQPRKEEGKVRNSPHILNSIHEIYRYTELQVHAIEPETRVSVTKGIFL